jgi:hypothetical protein
MVSRRKHLDVGGKEEAKGISTSFVGHQLFSRECRDKSSIAEEEAYYTILG